MKEKTYGLLKLFPFALEAIPSIKCVTFNYFILCKNNSLALPHVSTISSILSTDFVMEKGYYCVKYDLVIVTHVC